MPFFSKAYAVLLMQAVPMASTQECNGKGGSSCDVEEHVTSFMQIQRSLALGAERPVATANKDADERVASVLGRFKSLKSSFSDGVCNMEGTWDDGDSPAVTFHSRPSNSTRGRQEILLAIEGLPAILMQVDTQRNVMSSLELDGSRVISDSHISSSASLKHGFDAIFESSFAASGAKSLSSLLASNGLDGSKHACAHRLHKLLLSLAKGARAKQTALANRTSPYAPFDQYCPEHGSTTWECRTEPLSTGIGPFSVSVPEALAGKPSRYCIPGTPQCRGLKVNFDSKLQDIKCRPRQHVQKTWQTEGCQGMCGKGCDCWESICGPQYNCQYLKICCDHDYACSSEVGGGFMTAKCIGGSAVCLGCGGSKETCGGVPTVETVENLQKAKGAAWEALKAAQAEASQLAY
jgi:hypothetical protein